VFLAGMGAEAMPLGNRPLSKALRRDPAGRISGLLPILAGFARQLFPLPSRRRARPPQWPENSAPLSL